VAIDPKKGRAGAAVLSLEGQISELSMAIKEFKGKERVLAEQSHRHPLSSPSLQALLWSIGSVFVM
jgi:hypothetical protein